MEIYILRHGIAVERGTPGYKRDGDRPLTDEGVEKMRQIAKAMREMDLQFDVIFSSPYVRAKATADIVAETLGENVTLTDSLPPEADPAELIDEINGEKPQRVLLVGHEPDLSALISTLICGKRNADIELKKGGLAKLTAETLTYGKCATLNWLLTPKQLRQMR
ncbi:MAG: phosphohistidine phosphatase SixA [Acidobacteria bacterium]|nr:MAG: phosphohistidine phosphatase SixA [Acidobacteria bacterium 13_1_40CM_4_58_4]PYS29048.1 MAG: phosphohistidine phosphatase SixA [Acidobacteriota bacterium]